MRLSQMLFSLRVANMVDPDETAHNEIESNNVLTKSCKHSHHTI